MTDNIKRCPLCDYPDIYTGATNVECGYDKACVNWTQKQADEVERLTESRYPTPEYDADESYTGPFQFDLDWDKDENSTPTWPVPDFVAD